MAGVRGVQSRGLAAGARAGSRGSRGVVTPMLKRFFFRAIDLAPWLLWVSATAYLSLQPTGVATYARSLAFALAAYFTIVIFIASIAGWRERIVSPGAPLLIALAAWSLWATASWSWSVHPEYTADELRREVLFTLMVMATFYLVAFSATAWRALVTVLFMGFAVVVGVAIALTMQHNELEVSHWHAGFGPFSTYLVLVAPFLLTLLAPRPGGFGGGRVAVMVAVLLLLLLIGGARIAENRMVWIALAIMFAVAALVAAIRWRHALRRAPLRWLIALSIVLVALGALFGESVREKARLHFPPQTPIAQTFSGDPRLPLWEETLELIGERPLIGYGFGKSILGQELRSNLHDPLMSHPHNVFISQWLQLGAVGLLAFLALLGTLGWQYARFLRSADDTLALLGLIGVSLLVGFIVKNLTDDFLVRSNAKEFWALSAAVLGFGLRRERGLAPD
jgi:O-antigen ligase